MYIPRTNARSNAETTPHPWYRSNAEYSHAIEIPIKSNISPFSNTPAIGIPSACPATNRPITKSAHKTEPKHKEAVEMECEDHVLHKNPL